MAVQLGNNLSEGDANEPTFRTGPERTPEPRLLGVVSQCDLTR